MDRCVALRALAGLSALAGVGVAHAGPPPHVAAAHAGPLPELTTPAVLVVAPRPEALPEDPTSFTRVIQVDDYTGENKRVEDLLETTPGVFVRRFGGPGSPSEVSIRGSSGSQVVVLLDGVRLNSAQSGAVDLSTVPVELIERIEVSRGGGSVSQGSDAIGGVVNLVTKRASARPETRASGSAGSFETWQSTLSQTGLLGNVETLLGYDFFKTSGDWDFQPLRTPGFDEDTGSIERINNRSERHSGLLKLARDFGDRFRLEFSDQLLYSDDGRPGPAFGGGELAGQSPDGEQQRTRNVAQLRLVGADLSPLELDAELRAFHRFDRSQFSDGTLDPPVDSDDRNQSYGGRLDLSGEFDFRSTRQRPSLGLELRRDTLDPKQGRFRGRRVVGFFFQHELRLFGGHARIVPALRYDDTEGFDGEWIPRIGVMGTPWPWLELRANAERSYRVPNFDELFFDEGFVKGNPALRPEDAINVDAGFRLAWNGARWLRSATLELAGFYNDIDNTIVFQQVLQILRPSNIQDARIYGVELFARLAFTDWLAVSGSYTHLDTKVRATGNPIPGRPDDEGDVRLELTPFDGRVKLVGEVQHTGEIPVSPSGLRRVGDRTTVDASLAVELHRLLGLSERIGLSGLVFSVIGSNLTDQSVRDAQFFPQPGRALSFRLEAWR